MGLLNFDDEEQITSMASRERAQFNVYAGADMIRSRIDLPDDGESLRLISYAGQFSSCSVVLWVAAQTKIKALHITTLRVGKKELLALCGLRDDDRLGDVAFILSGLARENVRGGKDYGYADFFENICEEYGFGFRYEKNHSKVILMDTQAGKFVVETSSNFNENPKVEQFCITKSDAIYEFYKCGLFDNCDVAAGSKRADDWGLEWNL